jgi:hypothetical protein
MLRARMKFTAYIGFTFTAADQESAEGYAQLLLSALDSPSKDPRFEERLVESRKIERVEPADEPSS